MHFSKAYAQLLVTLPPELRNNPFEYRKLKRLINQAASELDSLGLAPSYLRSLHESEDGDETLSVDSSMVSDLPHKHIAYEIILNSSVLRPRLRLSSSCPSDPSTHSSPSTEPIYHLDFPIPERSLDHITQELLHTSIAFDDETHLVNHLRQHDHSADFIIPLPSDTAFFQLLAATLSSLSDHLNTLEINFNSTLTTLAASISSTARPASSSAPHSFSAYSFTGNNLMSLRPTHSCESDLYTWREIFRIYAEEEVFENIRESARGERSIEEVEKHLELFKGRVQGKKATLVLPRSRESFDVFLKLNMLILDVKRFQLANSEATRKILKKHAKRTTFPIPPYLLERCASAASSRQLMFITRPAKSLPKLLVQAMGEVLLPIVPHIDDYMCLICTSIAFKPIRLCCGHFFCLRCLVKMQRRHMANCPMCRAPSVLQANRTNVDYGLLNLMVDWFPVESREKEFANEREVNREQLKALGVAEAPACQIM